MSAGFDPARIARLPQVMQGNIEQGRVAGAVTLVYRRGETHADAVGAMKFDGPPMKRDTLFRVASLSKPVTAVAAMILVEECRLRLDDPVDEFLPELANRRVMKDPAGSPDETVPANRPTTLRDLLTMRLGLGFLFDPWPSPIMQALNAQGLLLGPPRPANVPAPDEWMRRVGTFPLMYQPGEAFLYELSTDILSILISRVSGQTLGTFLRERIFDPLGMKDTGFSVPPDQIHRLATQYATNFETGATELFDEAEDGQWSRPPAFESGGGGLVSTVDDYLVFGQMMLNGGRLGDVRILSRPTIEVMTRDHLTPEQRAGGRLILGPNRGWGLGLSVFVERDEIAASPGRYGWDGGFGTSFFVDPTEDLIGVLMTQQAWSSPTPPKIWQDFWTTTYQAIT